MLRSNFNTSHVCFFFLVTTSHVNIGESDVANDEMGEDDDYPSH